MCKIFSADVQNLLCAGISKTLSEAPAEAQKRASNLSKSVWEEMKAGAEQFEELNRKANKPK